jgi:hypothetical protein
VWNQGLLLDSVRGPPALAFIISRNIPSSLDFVKLTIYSLDFVKLGKLADNIERGIESQTSLDGLSKDQVDKALSDLVKSQTVG